MFEYSQEVKHDPNRAATEAYTARGLRFADLFAGMGGFHVALHELGATCVFASEINQLARATYAHNFRAISPELFANNWFVGDIRSVEPEDVPSFDVLCAGFPCQPFSISGRRRGFSDPRGDVFECITKIIDAKRPRAYILENVPNLISHNRGRTIERIRYELEENLGYSYNLKILRADEFNLPQYRPRTFIVGFRERAIRYEFPPPVELTTSMSEVFGAPCDRSVGFTLRVGGRRSPIDDKRNWDGYIVNGRERRLTPKEAKRMMGFPEWFDFPVSDWSALKQLGNSVAVPVARAVASEVIRCLRANKKLG